MLYLDFIDAHEGTTEVVKYLDVALSEFLEELASEGKLENTGIIMLADHGQHMNGIYSAIGGD